MERVLRNIVQNRLNEQTTQESGSTYQNYKCTPLTHIPALVLYPTDAAARV